MGVTDAKVAGGTPDSTDLALLNRLAVDQLQEALVLALMQGSHSLGASDRLGSGLKEAALVGGQRFGGDGRIDWLALADRLGD
ncbi:hypothetical protein D3C72_1841240 [compost metagenome]